MFWWKCQPFILYWLICHRVAQTINKSFDLNWLFDSPECLFVVNLWAEWAMRIIHNFLASRTFNRGITVTVQANVYSAQHISEIRGVCVRGRVCVMRWTDFRHACTNKTLFTTERAKAPQCASPTPESTLANTVWKPNLARYFIKTQTKQAPSVGIFCFAALSCCLRLLVLMAQ